VTSATVVVALERASLEIDLLLQAIHHNRRSVRSFEDVEERVQGIAGAMMTAVRGPGAAR